MKNMRFPFPYEYINIKGFADEKTLDDFLLEVIGEFQLKVYRDIIKENSIIVSPQVASAYETAVRDVEKIKEIALSTFLEKGKKDIQYDHFENSCIYFNMYVPFKNVQLVQVFCKNLNIPKTNLTIVILTKMFHAEYIELEVSTEKFI